MTDPSEANQELIEKNSVLKQKIVVRIDNVLNRVILIISILAGLGLIATPFLYERKMGSVIIILALLMTMIVAKLLIQRGHVRLSGIYTVFCVWLIFVFLLLLGGGLHNINVVFFISLTVMAGLLFGTRATILVAGAGIAMGFALALMAILGYLPPRYFLSSPVGDWAQLVFALILTASTLNLALRDRDNALSMANKHISDRLETEEALRESEKKYRLIAENTADLIAVMDLNLRFTYISPSIMRTHGFTVEEAMNMTIDQLLTPRSLQNLLTVVDEEAKIEATGTADPSRIRILEVEEYKKDGSVIWMESSVSAQRDKENKPIGILTVNRDITGRKRTEDALHEREDRYRQLVEYAPAAIYEADLTTGRLLSVNEVLCEYSGYTRDELLALNPLELMTEESQKLFLQRMAGYVTGDPVSPTVEYKARNKSGREFWISTNAKYFYQDGLPVRATVVAYDITERKQAEEEKRNLEERLNRAEKMEALGQLAGGVAHDLNNVLGVLTGYSELLMVETTEGQRARGYAEKILQSTEKGAAIIQDLLTLARRGVTVSDVLNLNDVISTFLKTPVFENIRNYHNRVTFRTEYGKNLLNIKGSPVHLEKTLINLVSNAAESISGKGEVTIRTENRYLDKTIRGYDEVKEGDYAVLTVYDTGMGIPAENREKIFEPFYTKKTMGKSGTGLGLAIVWGTVKDHNGYIDVQSNVGEGTTFTLYFPVTREELIAPQRKEPIERYMGNGESVLVIDDIAEQRDIAYRLLTRLGYKVHAVSSGEAAVEYLKGNKADILVLDMIMVPGIDGLETYRKVLEVNPKQRAILVSGFSETDRVREAQKLGAGVYVKKPYVIEKIGVALRDELNR
jgi:PAS domain S-box-containing protein